MYVLLLVVLCLQVNGLTIYALVKKQRMRLSVFSDSFDIIILFYQESIIELKRLNIYEQYLAVWES